VNSGNHHDWARSFYFIPVSSESERPAIRLFFVFAVVPERNLSRGYSLDWPVPIAISLYQRARGENPESMLGDLIFKLGILIEFCIVACCDAVSRGTARRDESSGLNDEDSASGQPHERYR
jgi:hypothetical protein